jgi:prolyl 4-hydroxylase
MTEFAVKSKPPKLHRRYTYVYVEQGVWRVHTNRVWTLVKPAIDLADQYLRTQHPAIQQFCQEQLRKTTLSFFDTYPGKHLPREEEPEHHTPISINILERKHTNYLADKYALARRVQKNKLEDYHPITHFSKQQALEYSDKDRVLFIKERAGTRGEGVRCVRSTELEQADMPDSCIIQESVSNLVLFANRKLVIRFYILIYNQCVYINRNGVAIVHGFDYDPESTEHRVQIQHNGKDAVIDRYPFPQHPSYEYWFEKTVESIKAFAPIFDDARKESSLFRYLLIGADGLPCTDERMRLLEFNTYPNMMKPPMETPVYIPVFSSLLLYTMAGINNNSWVRVL